MTASHTMTAAQAGAAAAPDSGLFGLTVSPEQALVVIQPVPWEATTSYGHGTQNAPEAILKASHQIDLFDIDTGKPYEAGIAMLPINQAWLTQSDSARQKVTHLRSLSEDDPEAEALRHAVNHASASMTNQLYRQTQQLLAQKKRVGTLGGDHASPLGAIKAHAEAFDELGILHIDAHADLRPAYEGLTQSHASIMHNVLAETSVKTLVQVGLRDLSEEEHQRIVTDKGRITAFFDAHVSEALEDGTPFSELAKRIIAPLPRDVYLSFDIDGLEPFCAPNTGTPVPGGLTFRQVVRLMAEVVRSKRRIVGFDLVEVSPGRHDEWDANVGARLLYKMCGFMLMSSAQA